MTLRPNNQLRKKKREIFLKVVFLFYHYKNKKCANFKFCLNKINIASNNMNV